MARRAAHRDEHVDAAAIAERDHQPGPAQDRHIGTHARALNHAPDGVVLAGFAGQAAAEDQSAGKAGESGSTANATSASS
jgi:hypothetical protein